MNMILLIIIEKYDIIINLLNQVKNIKFNLIYPKKFIVTKVWNKQQREHVIKLNFTRF